MEYFMQMRWTYLLLHPRMHFSELCLGGARLKWRNYSLR
uniref:Uncharacterized protein n=2 Tax=Anguilla anguilla TaxID=7936 RepID=A0A0E9QX39_ANGAN